MLKHSLSMVWRPQYALGIRAVLEPALQPVALDYEVFADITVMQMTQNHIVELIQSGVSPTFGRWLLQDSLLRPRLLVTKVTQGSYASSVVAPGMVLSELNGHSVSTLADYRRHFFDGTSELWGFKTERGSRYEVNFAKALMEQLERCRNGEAFLLTPAVLAVAQQSGLVQTQQQQEAVLRLAGWLSQMLDQAFEAGIQEASRPHEKQLPGGPQEQRQRLMLAEVRKLLAPGAGRGASSLLDAKRGGSAAFASSPLGGGAGKERQGQQQRKAAAATVRWHAGVIVPPRRAGEASAAHGGRQLRQSPWPPASAAPFGAGANGPLDPGQLL